MEAKANVSASRTFGTIESVEEEPAVVLQQERGEIGLWLLAFALSLPIQFILMCLPGCLCLAYGIRL